jgi:hypothetical protein
VVASRAAAAALALCVVVACGTARSTIVTLTFDNRWRVGTADIAPAEQALVKDAAFETLRHAFAGYAVEFVEVGKGNHIIRVEDTPFARDSASRMAFGAAGVTYPGAVSSSVRFDLLADAALGVLGCAAPAACRVPWPDLLAAIGRGVGATAAHELGHHAGMHFGRDTDCADCYDSASLSRVHFFGTKHWSAGAAAAMHRTLPRAATAAH